MCLQIKSQKKDGFYFRSQPFGTYTNNSKMPEEIRVICCFTIKKD
jgi:hypothetical protein